MEKDVIASKLDELMAEVEHNSNNPILINGVVMEYYSFDDIEVEPENDEDDEILVEPCLVFAINGTDFIFSASDVTSIEKNENGWNLVYCDSDTGLDEKLHVQVFKPA